KALADFKANRVQALVATDIAARGLDIDQLPQVVNFDLPNVAEDYVHRIGRTGRAGASGQAISLVANEEAKLLHDIERLINKQIERRDIEGFEADEPLPISNLNRPATKPKKAKQAKAGEGSGKLNDHKTRRRRRPSNSSGNGAGNKAGNKSNSKPGANKAGSNKTAGNKSSNKPANKTGSSEKPVWLKRKNGNKS
ncbi:MAG: helicase-related protein, partial [Cellvibrionaceae bacterium]|nr:helicase-related protein [Cellvibrionaceae bacterium]